MPHICHGLMDGVSGEKICQVEKFQIPVHDKMWRSLKFIHMWIDFKFLHRTDVEKSEISFNMRTFNGILLHFKLFCCKICVFLRFTLFCRKIGLLRFMRFCVEKILAKNIVRREKMTNMRYG